MVVLKCCYLLLCISIRGHKNNPNDPSVEVKPSSGADSLVGESNFALLCDEKAS